MVEPSPATWAWPSSLGQGGARGRVGTPTSRCRGPAAVCRRRRRSGGTGRTPAASAALRVPGTALWTRQPPRRAQKRRRACTSGRSAVVRPKRAVPSKGNVTHPTRPGREPGVSCAVDNLISARQRSRSAAHTGLASLVGSVDLVDGRRPGRHVGVPAGAADPSWRFSTRLPPGSLRAGRHQRLQREPTVRGPSGSRSGSPSMR
jgi:hypothetical protein